jgi:hypothetical protein
MACERPPRSLRSHLPLTRGRLALFSPSVRGRAAEGGRGSLTHHLKFLSRGTAQDHTPMSSFHKVEFERMNSVISSMQA